MTIVRSIVRPIVSAIAQAITGGGGAVSRFFTTLVSASSQHYTIPTATLTGDYKISYLVFYTGARLNLTGNTANNNSSVKINPAGDVFWRPETGATEVSTTLSPGIVPDNKLSIIEVERIGSNGTITVNGVEGFNGAVPTSQCVINTIGRDSADFATGIIANVLISGDSFASRSYAIDEDLSTTSTIVDSISGEDGTAVNITESELFTLVDGDWLGVELVTNGGFDTDTDWVKGAGVTISGGQAVFTSSAEVTLLDQDGAGYLNGSVYRLAFDFDIDNDVKVVLRSNSSADVTGQGSHLENVSITFGSGTKTRVQATGGGTITGTLDNLSTKRILEVA